MTAVEQQFPCRVGDRVTHRRWLVDVKSAARRTGIPEQRMAQEVEQMSQHFPRWLLTVAVGRELQRCRHCQAVLVFDDGLRCVDCQKAEKAPPPAARVSWFGVMPPVGIDGLPTVKASLARGAPPHHVVGSREGLGNFLLVPLVASYPAGFPSTPVDVHYLREFSQLAPTEQVSHTFHMLGQGRMCLFAPGEWYPAMSAREVLQQRGFPHLIKFLNYANGKRDAFAKVS